VDDSIFTSVLVPIGLAVVMTSLGLSLTIDDFKRVFVLPRGVMIGLANLLVISPFLAFGVAELYGLGAALAVGLVLLGASPGGTTANMLTHLARGDTALSISMTAISSVAAVITVPLFLELAIERFGASGFDSDVSLAGIVARVFLITLVPLAIGMRIRSRRPEWVARRGDRVRLISLIAFVVVVLAAIVAELDRLTENFGDVAAAALTLNVLAMTISFGIARAARLSDRQATAIAMELGVHNSTLAIAVATAIDTELIIPAAVYSMFMFVTAGLFARVMAGRNRAAPEPITAPADRVEPGPARAAPKARARGNPVWMALTAFAVIAAIGSAIVVVLAVAGAAIL
jgi:BASS family bile acid:Na+ symporter